METFSHIITYAVFQTMFALFVASPFSSMTAEKDYISIRPNEIEQILSQPKAVGLRYYFTLNKDKKISAVIFGVDSSGATIRRHVINSSNVKFAERDIDAFTQSGLAEKTLTRYSTIGIAYNNQQQPIITQAKSEFFSLAKSCSEVRAYYAVHPDHKNLMLVFAAIEKNGLVRQSSPDISTLMLETTSASASLLDRAADCPPFCRDGQ